MAAEAEPVGSFLNFARVEPEVKAQADDVAVKVKQYFEFLSQLDGFPWNLNCPEGGPEGQFLKNKISILPNTHYNQGITTKGFYMGPCYNLFNYPYPMLSGKNTPWLTLHPC